MAVPPLVSTAPAGSTGTLLDPNTTVVVGGTHILENWQSGFRVRGFSKFGIVVVQGPGELSLFDPTTNKPTGNVTVGKQPHWAATSGDGKTTYVTNEGSNDVTVVDLATGRTETIAVGNAPRKVVVQRTGPITRKGS